MFPQKQFTPNCEVAQDVLDQSKKIVQYVRENAMQAYIKYRAYYHKRKLKVSMLKERDYVYVLKPKKISPRQ